MVTCSGDSTIKMWDFSQKKCVHTFTNHLLPGEFGFLVLKENKFDFCLVWSVNFHSCGDFITSASQDKTVRLWDLNRFIKLENSY